MQIKGFTEMAKSIDTPDDMNRTEKPLKDEKIKKFYLGSNFQL